MSHTSCTFVLDDARLGMPWTRAHARTTLDATNNAAPKTFDERFDEVTQGFLDQRDYTAFCFEKLRRDMRQEIRQSEGRLARRLDRHELVLGEILTEVKAQRPR